MIPSQPIAIRWEPVSERYNGVTTMTIAPPESLQIKNVCGGGNHSLFTPLQEI